MFLHWQALAFGADPAVKINLTSSFSMPKADITLTEFITATVTGTGVTTTTYTGADGIKYTYHKWINDGTITFSALPSYQTFELFMVGPGGFGGYVDSPDAASGGGGGGGVLHLTNCKISDIYPLSTAHTINIGKGTQTVPEVTTAFGQTAGAGGMGGMAVITTFSYDQGNTNGGQGFSTIATLVGVPLSQFTTVVDIDGGGGGGGCGSYRGTGGSGSHAGGLGAVYQSTIANRASGGGGGISTAGTNGTVGVGGTGGSGSTYTIANLTLDVGSGGNGAGTTVGTRTHTSYGAGGDGRLLGVGSATPTYGVVIIKYKSHA